MRYVIPAFSFMLSLLAAPVYGDEACSTLPAPELSKAALGSYPSGWQKFENEKFALSFLYPPQLQKDDKPDRSLLSFSPHWCGDVKNSEPLSLEVRIFSSRAVLNQRERTEANKPALAYLNQQIFPSITPPRTASEDVHCTGKTIRRDTTTVKNGDLNYLRQVIDVDHGSKSFEFTFSYSMSAKDADKAKADAYSGDNTALECDIVNSMAFTEQPAAK